MRAKSLLTALLGFAVAGGSVIAANQYLDKKSRSTIAAESADLATVVVAATNIGFGQAIQPNMVTTQSWPASALPPGAFTTLQQVLPAGGGEPRRARRPLAQGELLLASKVSNFGEKVTIVQTLDDNSRAVAIRVDAVSGVGGFVTPGDRVDIILTQGSGEGPKAVTILQNVRVIAVDQVADEMKDKPNVARTVTVEVKPEETQKLALAQRAGRLSLTLRTPDSDNSDKPLEMTRLSDLLVQKSPPDEQTPQPVITVRRGSTVTEVSIGN